MSLRKPNSPPDRFFVGYRNGSCTVQPVGINTFGAIPKNIATFLGLENPKKYTGHCFRRSSATLLADSGAELTTLKRHGGWKSSTVAEAYIESSIENKTRIAKQILGDKSDGASTSTITTATYSLSQEVAIKSLPSLKNVPSTNGSVVASSNFQKSSFNNCIFNFAK